MCSLCESCPDEALYMADFVENAPAEVENWEFALKHGSKDNPTDKFTVKGSQFETPLMEFSGACAGCGETPYVKLMTQLFGNRMMIANASGCSSVWGGTSTTNPYTVDEEGRGPAWGRSLFRTMLNMVWVCQLFPNAVNKPGENTRHCRWGNRG